MSDLIDLPAVIALLIFVAALVATRTRKRGRLWHSSYAIVTLSVLHFAFLYRIPGETLGQIGSEEWAAITAAAIAGIATDDDAESVGLLLALLGAFQVFVIAGVLNLRGG